MDRANAASIGLVGKIRNRTLDKYVHMNRGGCRTNSISAVMRCEPVDFPTAVMNLPAVERRDDAENRYPLSIAFVYTASALVRQVTTCYTGCDYGTLVRYTNDSVKIDLDFLQCFRQRCSLSFCAL